MTPSTPFKSELFTESRQVRTPVLAELSSKQWRELGSEITERAFFAARVIEADLMDTLSKGIDSILNPKPGDRFHPSGVPVLEGETITTLRTKSRELLREISYQPENPGTIQDLRTDQRLNLIINTNYQMATGYAYWMKSQESLFNYPAFELIRGHDVKEPRDWEDRWYKAAVASSDMKALASFQNHGRKIALTDSPIWMAIATIFDDALGNPYAPFAFNSAMVQKRVERITANRVGVITGFESPKPQSRKFNEDLQASTSEMQSKFKESLMDALGPDWYQDSDGTIRGYSNVNRYFSDRDNRTETALGLVGTPFRYVDTLGGFRANQRQIVTLK